MADPLSRYPRKIQGDLVVRPLRTEDEGALVDFFRRVPLEECHLFKDDVRKVETIRAWTRHLDTANILPLLVFEGDRVIADATLHRDKRGWSRHVGKIRVTIDPERRGKGLARALVKEFLDLAPFLNLGILHAEVLDLQKNGQALFDSLGFARVAVLPQHSIDLAGRVHDVLIYSCTVVPPAQIAARLSLTEGDADIGGGA